MFVTSIAKNPVSKIYKGFCKSVRKRSKGQSLRKISEGYALQYDMM